MANVKEKLIELLTHDDCPLFMVVGNNVNVLADYLISNGVIVPPYKFGDDIWWIDNETNTVECEKNGVTGFVIKKGEILIRDKTGGEDQIGTQYCYLSKEDAEKALADRTKQCKYCKEEFCVNADCPMRADYCPVPDNPGVCMFEDRGKNDG